MTHIQLLTGRKLLPGMIHPDDIEDDAQRELARCTGLAVEVDAYLDRVIIDGHFVLDMVTVWRCTACEARISIKGEVILNHYHGLTGQPIRYNEASR